MTYPLIEIMIAGEDCHTCGAHLDSASMTSCSFTRSNIVRYVTYRMSTTTIPTRDPRSKIGPRKFKKSRTGSDQDRESFKTWDWTRPGSRKISKPCGPWIPDLNHQLYFISPIYVLRFENEIEKAVVSFEFLVDIHADDSEFTLLGQAGPAARKIILGANHQLFPSLSRYSGIDFKNYLPRKLLLRIISKSIEADTLRIRTEYYELTTSRSLDLSSCVIIISLIFTFLM